MKFVEEMRKVEQCAPPVESLVVPTEWEALKNRLDKKMAVAKDTSVIFRGKLEAKTEGHRQLDTDEVPADRKVVLLPPEDEGPERNSFSLLQGVKSGALDVSKLTSDERRIVVKALKDSGRVQDEIAAMLNVSRRTIVSDYKWLREASAKEVKELDLYGLAGEIYSTANVCIAKALSDGLYRTVSYVMRDMLEMLQSLGVAYRAPQQLRSMQITGQVPINRHAFAKYVESISGEEDKVIAVLDKLMAGIESGEIN